MGLSKALTHATVHYTGHSPHVTVVLASGKRILSTSTLTDVVRVLRQAHVLVRLSPETVQYLNDQSTIDPLTY